MTRRVIHALRLRMGNQAVIRRGEQSYVHLHADLCFSTTDFSMQEVCRDSGNGFAWGIETVCEPVGTGICQCPKGDGGSGTAGCYSIL